MKVKIRRLRRKKDKELSKLASQLIATSTPISFRERGEYSSESEDECGEKVDFLVSSQLWKCLSPGANLYPICNKKWVTGEYGKYLKDGNITLWKHMLSLYAISHPNICKLVKIIFSIAGNTGPLERSYSRLAKLCPKDRNKLSTSPMETQYIIGILKDRDYSFPHGKCRPLWQFFLLQLLLCPSFFKFLFKSKLPVAICAL